MLLLSSSLPVVVVLLLLQFPWTNEVVLASSISPRAVTTVTTSTFNSFHNLPRESPIVPPPKTITTLARRLVITTRRAAAGTTTKDGESLGQSIKLDNYILPLSHSLHPLLRATSAACSFEDAITRTSAADATSTAITTNNKLGEVNAHESFRYEWGTWLSAEKIGDIMDALGEMRLITGGLDAQKISMMTKATIITRMDEKKGEEGTSTMMNKSGSGGGGDGGGNKGGGKRIRIAGGKYWDIILHDLPRGA